MANKNGNPMPIKDVLGKLAIDDLRLKGKRVFIRADFNVPLDDNLRITDDSMIRSTLATINYAIDEGPRVILASHLGRPKGKPDPRYSLAPIAKRLQRLLDKDVIFAPDYIGSQVENVVSKMKDGDVVFTAMKTRSFIFPMEWPYTRARALPRIPLPSTRGRRPRSLALDIEGSRDRPSTVQAA